MQKTPPPDAGAVAGYADVPDSVTNDTLRLRGMPIPSDLAPPAP